jgi:hypothetical protein
VATLATSTSKILSRAVSVSHGTARGRTVGDSLCFCGQISAHRSFSDRSSITLFLLKDKREFEAAVHRRNTEGAEHQAWIDERTEKTRAMRKVRGHAWKGATSQCYLHSTPNYARAGTLRSGCSASRIWRRVGKAGRTRTHVHGARVHVLTGPDRILENLRGEGYGTVVDWMMESAGLREGPFHDFERMKCVRQPKDLTPRSMLSCPLELRASLMITQSGRTSNGRSMPSWTLSDPSTKLTRSCAR